MRLGLWLPGWLMAASLTLPSASSHAAPALEAPGLTLHFVDRAGRVLGHTEGVPIARTPPLPEAEDLEAVRVVAAASSVGSLPQVVTFTSLAAADGGQRVATLDLVSGLGVVSAPCPAGIEPGRFCAWTRPIRPVPDELVP